MHEFLFILLPAHLIYNIQHDSQINSNIYIPPLQLGEIINSMPIFKQKQAPISISCYMWTAPWGLHRFLRTARDLLSHGARRSPASAVFKHQGSQTLCAKYVYTAVGWVMHLYRGTEWKTGKQEQTTSSVSYCHLLPPQAVDCTFQYSFLL